MNPFLTLSRYWQLAGFVTPFLYYWRELMEIIMIIFVLCDRTFDQATLSFQNSQSKFDYIIVGGGTAGSILATRLSLNYSVLLLEAGGVPTFVNNLPLHLYILMGIKSMDWSHKTTPQKHAAFGLKDNVMYMPGGKALGGSSVINGMIYIRGNVQGFNEVAEKTEEPIWKMENMLKYFQKIENYEGAYKDGPAGIHGKGGHTNIESTTVTLPVTKQLLKAGQELGYSIKDPNIMGPYTEGFSRIELMTKSGARHHLYDSLLWLQRDNPNLTVRKFSHVTKVLFDGTEAYGVEYERHGKTYTANASNEVILSAGALMSPKILMLSGIGPKEHLEEVGIKTILDLPVGQQLQDKYGGVVGPILMDEGTSFLKTRDISSLDFLEYLSSGTGIFSTTRTEATLAISTNSSRKQGKTSSPNVHGYVMVYSVDNRNHNIMPTFYNAHQQYVDYYEKHLEKDMLSILLTIAKPNGYGTFKLRDKNPHSEALIDPKYLEDEQDVADLVEGVNFIMKLTETEAMKKINARLSPVMVPGCKMYEFKSDKYYECLLRYQTHTAYKFCGTAPLGKDTTDPFAVVDPHLRVLGAKKLRVVDASVLNTKYVSVNDVVVRAIAEMISELILDSSKDGSNAKIKDDNNSMGLAQPKVTQNTLNISNNETSITVTSISNGNENITPTKINDVSQLNDPLPDSIYTVDTGSNKVEL